MKLNKQELWEERIIAFESSGLSRRAWSKELGIPEHQVHYWFNKLRPSGEISESKRWVALPPTSPNDTGVYVQVGDLSIAVKQGFDHHVLVEVIQALTAIC